MFHYMCHHWQDTGALHYRDGGEGSGHEQQKSVKKAGSGFDSGPLRMQVTHIICQLMYHFESWRHYKTVNFKMLVLQF
jgi:hypothetical protein